MEIKELRKQNADLLLALREVGGIIDSSGGVLQFAQKVSARNIIGAAIAEAGKAPAANAGGLPSIDALINALPRYKTNRQGLLNQSPTEDGALVFISDLRAALADADRAPAADAAGRDEREAFEAWHRSKFATKHSTGQPTRDMHNGVYAEKYGPEHQQQMWEAWQAARSNRAPATSAAALPAGYVLMPERLTAENGAKGALSGEFKESFSVTCHECGGSGDDAESDNDAECPECKGDGTIEQDVPITWDTIKDIYRKAVEVCAHTPTAKGAGGQS